MPESPRRCGLTSMSAERLPATRNEQLQPVEFAVGKIPFVRTDGRLDLAERDARLRREQLGLDRVKERREFAAHLVYHRERVAMHGRGSQPQQRRAVLGGRISLVRSKAVARIF